MLLLVSMSLDPQLAFKSLLRCSCCAGCMAIDHAVQAGHPLAVAALVNAAQAAVLSEYDCHRLKDGRSLVFLQFEAICREAENPLRDLKALVKCSNALAATQEPGHRLVILSPAHLQNLFSFRALACTHPVQHVHLQCYKHCLVPFLLGCSGHEEALVCVDKADNLTPLGYAVANGLLNLILTITRCAGAFRCYFCTCTCTLPFL